MTRVKIWAATLMVLSLGVPVANSVAAEPTPSSLEGQWRVVSATWQLGGAVTYTFKGDTLTIETRIEGGKGGGEPPQIYLERLTFVFDTNVTPYRLAMKPIAKTASPLDLRTETVTFDGNGMLWLSGSPGWKTGLLRIK